MINNYLKTALRNVQYVKQGAVILDEYVKSDFALVQDGVTQE